MITVHEEHSKVYNDSGGCHTSLSVKRRSYSKPNLRVMYRGAQQHSTDANAPVLVSFLITCSGGGLICCRFRAPCKNSDYDELCLQQNNTIAQATLSYPQHQGKNYNSSPSPPLAEPGHKVFTNYAFGVHQNTCSASNTELEPACEHPSGQQEAPGHATGCTALHSSIEPQRRHV